MVHSSVIEARLAKLNVKVSSWFKAEIRELQKTMADDEEVVALVTGRYYGGYAMLVATNHRLLMIDKKTFFMAFEDIRYDMISEIDFSARMFDATITIFTINKQHRFTCFKHRHQLRLMTTYIQQRLMQIRNGVPEPTTQSQLHPAHIRQMFHRATGETHQLLGAAAMRATAWRNPYVGGGISIKQQWSRASNNY